MSIVSDENRKNQSKEKLNENNAALDKSNSLHHALGPFLIIGKCFGILPVSGTWPNHDVKKVHFHWCSLATLLTVALIIFTVIDLFLSIGLAIERSMSLKTADSLSFGFVCVMGFIMFLSLARQWPSLILLTRQCEESLLQHHYTQRRGRGFSKRLRLIGTLLFIGAIVEHLCYTGVAVYSNHLEIRNCNVSIGFWQNFFERERMPIFAIVDYNVWLLPVIEYITIATTFNWNFIDVFLAIIARSVALRMQLIFYRLKHNANHYENSQFWSEIRHDLMLLIKLLQHYDEKLSNLILLSCANNAFFICVRIFYSFQQRSNFMTEMYFWYSLLFVMTRFLVMLFAAASIDKSAKKVANMIFEIPTTFWCLELKRISEIVTREQFAFSGKGFFYLTRGLIIAMFGKIVIYEIVLLDRVDKDELIDDLCP